MLTAISPVFCTLDSIQVRLTSLLAFPNSIISVDFEKKIEEIMQKNTFLVINCLVGVKVARSLRVPEVPDRYHHRSVETSLHNKSMKSIVKKTTLRIANVLKRLKSSNLCVRVRVRVRVFYADLFITATHTVMHRLSPRGLFRHINFMGGGLFDALWYLYLYYTDDYNTPPGMHYNLLIIPWSHLDDTTLNNYLDI